MPGPDVSALIEGMVTRWAGLIRRAASRFGLQQAELDELIQDVRLRIWRALEQRGADPDALQDAYGYQVAVSAAIDMMRALRSRRRLIAASLDEVTEGAGSSGAIGPGEVEILAALNRALGNLPEDRRVAVRLHLSGCGLDEIARITGWSSVRARNLMYRGLEALKLQLQDPEGADL